MNFSCFLSLTKNQVICFESKCCLCGSDVLLTEITATDGDKHFHVFECEPDPKLKNGPMVTRTNNFGAAGKTTSFYLMKTKIKLGFKKFIYIFKLIQVVNASELSS